jgi:hypothetical protein
MRTFAPGIVATGWRVAMAAMAAMRAAMAGQAAPRVCDDALLLHRTWM